MGGVIGYRRGVQITLHIYKFGILYVVIYYSRIRIYSVSQFKMEGGVYLGEEACLCVKNRIRVNI